MAEVFPLYILFKGTREKKKEIKKKRPRLRSKQKCRKKADTHRNRKRERIQETRVAEGKALYVPIGCERKCVREIGRKVFTASLDFSLSLGTFPNDAAFTCKVFYGSTASAFFSLLFLLWKAREDIFFCMCVCVCALLFSKRNRKIQGQTLVITTTKKTRIIVILFQFPDEISLSRINENLSFQRNTYLFPPFYQNGVRRNSLKSSRSMYLP